MSASGVAYWDDTTKSWIAVTTALPLPVSTSSGEAGSTEAKQDTIIGHVDGLETLVTATNSALTNGKGKSASAAFTPAAASHVAGDCNGAAATFALAAPSGCVFMITDVSLLIAGATIETTAWTLYLYNVTPPSAIADDGVFDLPSGDQASFLGSIAISQVVDLGAALWIEMKGVNRAVKLAGTGLFGYLVNGTTLTPQAVAHTVTITGYPL